MLQKLHHFSRVFVGLDPYFKIQYKCLTKSFGSAHARWTICPTNLSKKSIVYSFGIGDDISFDLGLIKDFGLIVYAFDPTPRSLNWIKLQKLPPQFITYPWGIADFNGLAYFKEPLKSTHVSFRLIGANDQSRNSLPVYTLERIMKKLGHQKIDILKLDIEGAEYKVIKNILNRKVNIDQILVEFHHRFKGLNKNDTVSVVNQLNKLGYFVFHISEIGTEFSFIKVNNNL